MAGLFDKQAEVADHYTQVIGIDISEHQLKLAKPHPRVRYLHTPLSLSGDDLIDLLGGESSVDLVTVAEAVHWFETKWSWSAIVTAKEKGVDLLSENVVQELESVWG
ncbi:putative methyltransferase, partial [Tanacetum coccineum]